MKAPSAVGVKDGVIPCSPYRAQKGLAEVPPMS
jgi:hypothetical protein